MKTQFWSWMLVGALAAAASAQGEIHLKSGALARGAGLHTGGRPAGSGHYILQFERFPDAAVLRELIRRGVRVLEYVPDNGLLANLPEGFDGAGLGMTGWVRMSAEDKLSPLNAGAEGYYVAVFQPDANMADARALVESYGFQVLPNPAMLPQQLLIAGDSSHLASLAQWDEVSYIMPASPELVSGTPVLSCPGAVTAAGPVGNYVLVSQGWPADATGVMALHYVLGALPAQLDAALVTSEIARAFAAWQQYANISLTPGTQADAARTLFVEFVNGAHGDAYPFTSTASLAHTFYPDPPNAEPIAGDMHLNAAENWSIGSGVDVFSVALHEAGHALGLGHSDQPSAVMYPYYHLASGLSADDIAGIQALYGAPGAGAATPAIPPPAIPPATNPPATNPPAVNPTPPSLAIISPASTILSTSAAALVVSGTAAAGVGIASVQWNDAFGDSGAAAGTTSWTATIPLLEGTNSITIRVYDQAGNSAWRSLTVVRN